MVQDASWPTIKARCGAQLMPDFVVCAARGGSWPTSRTQVIQVRCDVRAEYCLAVIEQVFLEMA